MESRKPYLATLPGLILGCLVCCALWGSAFPCIKIGYGLFGIPAHDSASQLLFAGLRFTLAGMLVIVGMSVAQHRPLVPQARDIKPICILSLFQTIGQYFFFYLGLSRASAMSSSIIEASANFLAILFAGVALVNLSGADGTFGFALDGEGFILASTVAGALSTCLIGIFSREHDGVLLAGWQFLVGGLVLTAIGLLMGGALSPTAIAPAIALIIYMALISAVAYSLWSRLLAVNPVSRVSVFGFMNPVFGVLLSALLLGEGAGTSPVTVIVALLLVCGGIIIVNRPKKA
ncbi:MAG: DMT family transporter [Collinsella sp.]